MAANALELNTVSRGMALAKKILDEVKPVIDQLNVAYDTANTGVKATLTQEKLDAVASYSGITKAQVDDGMYVLTATLKGAIDAAYTQLAQLAVRG